MTRILTGITRTALGASFTLLCCAAPALAQAADNTQVNKRDQAAGQLSADRQKNNRSDIAITRDIRRALVADKNLSTYAHNVKVITQRGDVTLKGPVRSEEEKKVVEAKATDVAGAGHVTNQISIAPSSAKRRTKAKA
jgi:hyperosmotically inducible protein